MPSYFFDIIFALLALYFVISGWQKGFVRMIGGLLGLVVGVACGVWGVGWIEDTFGIPLSTSVFSSIAAFFVLFGIARMLMQFVITLLDVLRRMVTLIPGFGLVHRLLGALVGVVEAGVIIFVCVYGAYTLLPQSDVRSLVLASRTADWVLLYAF